DAALLRPQGEDVARTEKVLGPRRRIDGGEDGGGAVGGGDARGDLAAGLDGDGEGGAEGRGVGLHHEGEVQGPAAFLGQGEADEAAAVLGHEVDGRRRDFLGRDGEVALVLAVLVVADDDDLAPAEAFDRLLDGGEGCLLAHGEDLLGFAAARGRSRKYLREARRNWRPDSVYVAVPRRSTARERASLDLEVDRDRHHGRQGGLVELRRLKGPLPDGVEGGLVQLGVQRSGDDDVRDVSFSIDPQLDDDHAADLLPPCSLGVDRMDVVGPDFGALDDVVRADGDSTLESPQIALP